MTKKKQLCAKLHPLFNKKYFLTQEDIDFDAVIQDDLVDDSF